MLRAKILLQNRSSTLASNGLKIKAGVFKTEPNLVFCHCTWGQFTPEGSVAWENK